MFSHIIHALRKPSATAVMAGTAVATVTAVTIVAAFTVFTAATAATAMWGCGGVFFDESRTSLQLLANTIATNRVTIQASSLAPRSNHAGEP